MDKKNKPKFNVLNFGFFKSVKERWRKPRGTHNKKRMKCQWAGAFPRIGYKNPDAIRGLRPDGNEEILVHNVAELENLKDVFVRVAAGVGAKKREQIEKKAEAMELIVVNMHAKKEKKEGRGKEKRVKKKEAKEPKQKAKAMIKKTKEKK